MTPSQVKSLCYGIFKQSTADATEIMLNIYHSGLTRYANNMIHQHVEEQDVGISIRTIIGKKTASASTNQFDPKSLDRTLHKAIELAKHQKPIENLLPLVKRQSYKNTSAYVERTADSTPIARARVVKGIIEEGRRNNLVMAGALSTQYVDRYLAGSNGVFAHFPSTLSELSVAALNGDRMGFRESAYRDVKLHAPRSLTQGAIHDATHGGAPREIKPGVYPTLLTSKASADMILNLASHFGALAVEEGRSCFSGKMGKPIFSEKLVISDDVFNPRMSGTPFDYEGIPRQRIVLVKNGKVDQLVHDRSTAKKARTTSTGHSLPVPNDHGPMPMNLVVQTGKSSFQDLVHTMKRGILLSGLHYVNVVDPQELVITGMTKGTAFWIENGEIAYPLKTLRFNQSVLETLKYVEEIGNETGAHSEWGSVWCVAPSILTERFAFTSGTKF